MRILLLLLAAYVAAVALGTRAEAQNYPWCAIYSGGMGGGGTTPRAGSAAFASQIRNTSLRPDRIH
jgi:hypothetical protein